METKRKVLITAMLGVGAMALGAGCGGPDYDEPRHARVETVAVDAPVTYVYEPGYYDRGYYRDNYWYWHGRDGHVYREMRDAHERREREWADHQRHDVHEGDRDHRDHR